MYNIDFINSMPYMHTEHVPVCATAWNNLTTCKWKNCLQKMDINLLVSSVYKIRFKSHAYVE